MTPSSTNKLIRKKTKINTIMGLCLEENVSISKRIMAYTRTLFIDKTKRYVLKKKLRPTIEITWHTQFKYIKLNVTKKV